MKDCACPVCDGAATRPLLTDPQGRAYRRCETCLATFLDPVHFLTADAEHAHYLTHENDVDDPRYRSFLDRLAGPLLARLQPGSRGLDYGCGPGPALAAMLAEAGHGVALYDPFFAPDADVLAGNYDFITCTETAEHFHRPGEEFARLASMLAPGGILAVMTMFQSGDERFQAWHYRLDPTHVVFYRPETFAVLAERLGLECEVVARNVVFLTRT